MFDSLKRLFQIGDGAAAKPDPPSPVPVFEITVTRIEDPPPRRLFGEDTAPAAAPNLKRPFRIELDSLEDSIDFISLPDAVWDLELKPRAESIASNRDAIKAELAKLRAERKLLKTEWDSCRRQLAATDRERYRELKAAHEEKTRSYRTTERALLDQKESTRQAWIEHYADIRTRRRKIFDSTEQATREALEKETRWYFFLLPGERVVATRTWRSVLRAIGEQTVRAGAPGAVAGLVLLEGRYAFQMLFESGTDGLVAEFDPLAHGDVLQSMALPATTTDDERVKFLMGRRRQEAAYEPF